MKKMDENGRLLSIFVSDLFKYSVTQKDCSSKVFIKAYVYSSLEKERLNSDSFLFDSLDVPEAYEIIKKKKKLTRGNDIYPSYIMAWIGYIMKYFNYVTGIPLASLYKKMKPDEFYAVYEAYHSLDNDLVVERILESKEFNYNLNNLELLKNIYFKK